MRYIDVILPLAISEAYTYAVPEPLPLPAPGARVLVPLGKKQITGIVLQLHPTEETGANKQELDTKKGITIRPILEVLDLDENALWIDKEQLRLWQWIAQYYMCTLGEVLIAALPSGILDDDYTARTVSYIQWGEGWDKDKANEAVSNRAVKQKNVLATFVRLSEGNTAKNDGGKFSGGSGIEKRWLIEESGEGTAIVRTLVERGILKEVQKEVSRLIPYTGNVAPAHPLSAAQAKAYEQIIEEWKEKAVCLLYGVTSSGKTEVYIHLIQHTLAQGKSALFLVPEIALTTQLTARLQAVFGNKLLVYHSRFSQEQRVEIYKEVLENKEAKIIIGARSAVFLPFHDLGLIIVDEEHEPSYKQQDPAPRYHARSVAQMLGRWHGAKVLLGSATPAIETYFHARRGTFGLVELTERYAGLQLPNIHIIDLKEQYRRKEMYGHLSDPLVAHMHEELRKGKQIILFQNRRGYAPIYQCTSCGNIPKCGQCDVTLTVHKQSNELVCHYCGYHTAIPKACPSCGAEMKEMGFGTERIEEEVKELFPKARVLRMDLDTTRNKNAHQEIINAVARHEVDILIGTQMVSKGLHFDDVSTVAVLNADGMLSQPDFRSIEKSYQQLEQVAGRAGRKGAQGEVFIQTFDKEQSVFGFVEAHHYFGLYHAQLADRQLFHYPPYYRMISVSIKHTNLERVVLAAEVLQICLQRIFGDLVSAVIVPSNSRIRNTHIRQIHLRIPAQANVQEAKRLLQEQIKWCTAQQGCKGVAIVCDVDTL